MTRYRTDVGPGITVTMQANVPGTPQFVGHTSSSITVAWDANGNGSETEYALYLNELSKYVGADGAPDESSAVWQTLAQWDEVTVTGLSLYTAYTFKVKARDEAEVETDWSSDSEVMNCLPAISEGHLSDNIKIDVSNKTIKIFDFGALAPGVSGDYATDEEDSFYGDISVDFYLQSFSSFSGNGITVHFTEDDNLETASWTLASEGSGSCGTTGLAASTEGTLHTYVWDSYADSGESQEDSAVYLRITPEDSVSAAGDPVIVGPFGVDNRPAKIVWERYYGGETDSDTTPTLRAVIPSSRGGGPMFPRIKFVNETTSAELELKSIERVAGWRYEYPAETWNDLTPAGIPAAAADGANELEITVQDDDALSEGGYLVNGSMFEVEDLS